MRRRRGHSSLLIAGPIDGPAFQAKLAIEVGQVFLACRRQTYLGIGRSLQRRGPPPDVGDDPKIFRLLGNVGPPAAALQDPAALPGDLPPDHAPLTMQSLPPRFT